MPLLHGRWWLLAAAAIGVVPVLIASRTGGAWHQLASAFLLFPLFLAAVRDFKVRRQAAVALRDLSANPDHTEIKIGA